MGWPIVAHVGFWERQVGDLLTGISELVGGGPVPLSRATPTPRPVPPPSPGSSMPLPPHPAYQPTPQPSGGWPPYLPEGQLDLSEGTDAANAAARSLKRNMDAITDTDQQLGQAVSHTREASARAQQRLVDIDAQIRSQVAALQPFMNSLAGQQQLAALLMTKTREVQSVVAEATRTSRTQSTVVDGLRQRYNNIRTTGNV